MPPLFPFLQHNFEFLHHLYPRQWHKLGPLPRPPFHPTLPHVLKPLHTLQARQFRLPINTTSLPPPSSTFPPLRNNPQYRYHPTIEFVVNLLRWIFSMLHTVFGGGPARPKPPPDYEQAQQVVVRFWKWVLFVLLALLGMILFLLFVIRVCVTFDRHQSKHGQVGVELARREDAMIRACEEKGRKVIQRLERRRQERIWREEDKRQQVRDEYLRRQSILQGKLPVLSMMREESIKLGREVIDGVGEGPAPRPELGRSTSKRKERRGHGTQVLSEEEDTLRKSPFHRLPRGAEGRIGNSVWRSNSQKTLQRRFSEPEVFIKNKTLGRLGVKRNASFMTEIQDRLDEVFNVNNEEGGGVRTSLLEKDATFGRTLSFSRGTEILVSQSEVEKLNPHFRHSTVIHHLPGTAKDKGATSKQNSAPETFAVRNRYIYANAPIEGDSIGELRARTRGLDEMIRRAPWRVKEAVKNESSERGDEGVRREGEVWGKQVEGGDVLPSTSPPSFAETSPLEKPLLNSEWFHFTPALFPPTTREASNHSAETISLHSAASHAALVGADLQSQSRHDDESETQPDHHLLKAHLSTNTLIHIPLPTTHTATAPSSAETTSLLSVASVESQHSHSLHDADSDSAARAHSPLLGAHLRSSSIVLHTPSPTMHPVTAQSSVERLEAGVRSTSSINSLYDAVSLRNSMASVNTVHDAMALLAKDPIDRKLVERSSEVVRTSDGADGLLGAVVISPRSSAQRRWNEEGSEERNEMVKTSRLSFEEAEEWVSDASGRHEEDRVGRQEWEVDEDKKSKGGLVMRASSCAQQ